MTLNTHVGCIDVPCAVSDGSWRLDIADDIGADPS